MFVVTCQSKLQAYLKSLLPKEVEVLSHYLSDQNLLLMNLNPPAILLFPKSRSQDSLGVHVSFSAYAISRRKEHVAYDEACILSDKLIELLQNWDDDILVKPIKPFSEAVSIKELEGKNLGAWHVSFDLIFDVSYAKNDTVYQEFNSYWAKHTIDSWETEEKLKL